MAVQKTRPLSSKLLLAAAVALSVLGASLYSASASAYDEQSVSAVNVDSQGIALQGFDPVAYHLQGAPAKGKAALSEKFEGATYWFASTGNRDTFRSNPGKYAPAYGGFCAMGVALEKKLDIDPQLWRIVDGKLYLNVHKAAQGRWLEDPKANIRQADAIWARIQGKAPKSL